jgi:hypothetical protein
LSPNDKIFKFVISTPHGIFFYKIFQFGNDKIYFRDEMEMLHYMEQYNVQIATEINENKYVVCVEDDTRIFIFEKG